jgi:hypothetical protein
MLFFSSQVTSAFGILILVMSIYAVMAVDLFSVQDAENFGNLSRALFTIFQVTFFFFVEKGDDGRRMVLSCKATDECFFLFR